MNILKTTRGSGAVLTLRQFSHFRYHGATLNKVANSLPTPTLLGHELARRSIHTSFALQKKDYYDTLGVNKSVDAKELKKAYYKLAKEYHPDVNKDNPDAAQKFQEVSEAYEVLSDDSKRQQYDTFGHSMGQQAPPGGGGHPGGFGASMNPEDLFANIFGKGFRFDMGGSGMGGRTDDFEAPSMQYNMRLTFQQAVRGCDKDLSVTATDVCGTCNGERCKPGSRPTKCGNCGGTGTETMNTGPFIMQATCRACNGERVVIRNPCTECNGKGKTKQRRTVTVPVPAGVEDGQTVRMAVGQSEIFITFQVESSRELRREGADIHSDVQLSVAQALLGGTVRVRGVYDEMTVDVPAGTSSHAKMRLAGKGVQRNHSHGRGDHYIHFKVNALSNLTDEQRALILTYAETERNINGTVTGITQTYTGKAAMDDKRGLVSRIRLALDDRIDIFNVGGQTQSEKEGANNDENEAGGAKASGKTKKSKAKKDDDSPENAEKLAAAKSLNNNDDNDDDEPEKKSVNGNC